MVKDTPSVPDLKIILSAYARTEMKLFSTMKSRDRETQSITFQDVLSAAFVFGHSGSHIRLPKAGRRAE